MGKSELRRQLLKQRQQMSVTEWREKSDRLCTTLSTSPLFQRAQTILAYFSHRQEPDLTPLYQSLTVNWGFPRTVDQSLFWHGWKPGEPLQTGKFGILEPHPDLPLLTANQVDLILVPAVGCDRHGYRLGYGGGYYDRLLSSPEWKDIPTIGIIFDFAYFTELPKDAWDQPLTAICTETQLIIIDQESLQI